MIPSSSLLLFILSQRIKTQGGLFVRSFKCLFLCPSSFFSPSTPPSCSSTLSLAICQHHPFLLWRVGQPNTLMQNCGYSEVKEGTRQIEREQTHTQTDTQTDRPLLSILCFNERNQINHYRRRNEWMNYNEWRSGVNLLRVRGLDHPEELEVAREAGFLGLERPHLLRWYRSASRVSVQ